MLHDVTASRIMAFNESSFIELVVEMNVKLPGLTEPHRQSPYRNDCRRAGSQGYTTTSN